MRIYFKKNGDSNSRGSVDVYLPNGNRASLLVSNTYNTSSGNQRVGRNVTISGTSITQYGAEGFSNPGSNGTTTVITVYIYRVEAWNE